MIYRIGGYGLLALLLIGGLAYWYSTEHVVILLENKTGRAVSRAVVEYRDGLRVDTRTFERIRKGGARWMSIETRGYLSYLLEVQFDDGETYKTLERQAETRRLSREVIGPKDSFNY